MAALPPPVVVLKSAPKPSQDVSLRGRVTIQCIDANGRVKGASGIMGKRAKPFRRVKGTGGVGEECLLTNRRVKGAGSQTLQSLSSFRGIAAGITAIRRRSDRIRHSREDNETTNASNRRA